MPFGEARHTDGSESSFHQWLAAARAGSSDALGKLLGPMRPGLKHDASQKMSPILQRREDASDVVNTTCYKAVRDFDDFSGDQPAQFRAWVRTILNNTLAQLGRHYSTEKRNAKIEEPMGSAIEELDRSDRQPSPSSLLSRKEWKAEVRRAILRLSENHQRVLRLRYELQLDFDDVAGQLGISVDAAKHLWGRAVKELAGELRRFRPSLDVGKPPPQRSAGA